MSIKSDDTAHGFNEAAGIPRGKRAYNELHTDHHRR